MALFDTIRAGASGTGDYEIERSLRFNNGDSPNLTRTPSSASNRRTFTISAWVKRSSFGAGHTILSQGTSGSDFFGVYFPSDQFSIRSRVGGSDQFEKNSTGVYRDVTAWMHVLVAVDTTQSTAEDRAIGYLNGVRVTNYSANTIPAQNTELNMNTTETVYIGSFPHCCHWDGYIAELQFIDGQALTPSSFAETDAATGEYKPIKYTGTYGTNGFYLNFSDNSGTTATTLGKDLSGNGNNFTPNNLSVSAGAGNDSLEDTPTNNFCVLNPLDKMGTVTVSEGNLKVVINGDNASLITGSFGVSSGKWYYEAVADTAGAGFVGWIRKDVSTYTGYPYQQGGTLLYFSQNGGRYKDGDGGASYGASYTDGDIIGCAINLDDNEVTWYKNNASQGTLSIEAGTYNPNTTTGGSGATFTFNFGQRAFSYTPPTGFKALNSANLPDPTILLPDKHFETLVYSGNGGTQSITGLNFQPDWVWVKNRTGTNSNVLFDAVRGATKELISNVTNSEGTEATSITSFDSNGFSVGSNGGVNSGSGSYVAWNWDAGETDSATYTVKVVSDSGNKYRFNDFGTSAVTLDLAEGGTYTFDQSDSSMSSHPMQLSTTANGTHGGGSAYSTGVTYQLDGSTVTASAFISGFSSASSRKLIITVAASAPTLYYYCYYHSGMGGAVNTNSTLGSSNFDGTNQTVVKANTTAGFSIISYTGTGSTNTIGHGLGVTPKVYIIKNRDSSDNWIYYTTVIDGSLDFLYFTTGAKSNSINTAPTSTVIEISGLTTNDNGDKHICYAFSEVEGYSKFGKYTGNGSTDGTFVYTGFRPALVITKQTNSTGSWFIFDNKRNGFNETEPYTMVNTSNVEATDLGWDLLSNGFKQRNSYSATNSSGNTFTYLAFAESPFKNNRAR